VEHPQSRPLSRYPVVMQDMALIVAEDVAAAQVEEAIRRAGGELLASVTLFDVYTGDPIPEGHRNLAYRLVYQALDETLTEERVSRLHERIARHLEAELGAKLRE